MFDWISNCADGVVFSGCIFNCLLDFTNLFNTMIVTTKISRDIAPNPAPMAIYNVRPLSVKDKKCATSIDFIYYYGCRIVF